jgi:KDO2-lipid IV(A) lauroyltransferase
LITRLGLALVWLLRLVPLRLLAALGGALGTLLYAAGAERRRVALINLELCFPQMASRERKRIARAHFKALTRSMLERGINWWSSAGAVRRLVRLEGEEHEAGLHARLILIQVPAYRRCQSGCQSAA